MKQEPFIVRVMDSAGLMLIFALILAALAGILSLVIP